MRGLGTVINVLAILAGSGLGLLIGHRLPERTRVTVTDALGLVTLVIGGLNCVALVDDAYVSAVGSAATLLIVLGALILGGIIGSLLRIEDRLESAGGWLQSRLTRSRAGDGRARFIEGFVNSSLVFCIGPLAIMGSLSDGLGQGSAQLVLKSSLDFFGSLAFAAAMGWGVAASAISVGAFQGLVTVLGVLMGSVLSDALIASITATGGVLLLGVGLRLLHLRAVAVGDLLPALLFAPILTVIVSQLR